MGGGHGDAQMFHDSHHGGCVFWLFFAIVTLVAMPLGTTWLANAAHAIAVVSCSRCRALLNSHGMRAKDAARPIERTASPTATRREAKSSVDTPRSPKAKRPSLPVLRAPCRPAP